jgi:leucyl-tRNA synthetase
VIEEFGADSMRLFEMFMGPLEATKPWSTEGMAGMNRFLNRVWRLIVDDRTGEQKSNITSDPPDAESLKLLHKTIKKITNDIEDGDMKFNTSIAQLMIFTNELYRFERISKSILENFILILSPFSPHIAEELWERLGNQSSTITQNWPEFDEELAKEDNLVIAFSVNGKVRAKVEIERDTDEKTLEQAALDNESIKKYISGKQIIKIITVINKMVNIVIK